MSSIEEYAGSLIGAELITDISTGKTEFRVTPLRHDIREITVFVETDDLTAKTPVNFHVAAGSGHLIFKQDGKPVGLRIIEVGTTGQLPAGTTYCYRRGTNLDLKVLEHAVQTPSAIEAIGALGLL